ncbi:MAG: hypothetical protein RL145_593, partial [Pseudomonadota bacterium]
AFGDLTINTQHRWTTKSETGLFSDNVLVDDAGRIGEPIYNSTSQIQFRRKDWTYAWTIDAVGQTNQTTVADRVAIAPGTFFAYTGASTLLYKTKTEATITHDLSVQYRSDNWTLVGGVSNLFNEEPPAISTGVFFARLGESPLVSQYDLVGRSVFASITRRF